MSNYFVGRQPIFDRELQLHGYELLYRTSLHNAVPRDMDDEKASAWMLSISDELGISNLVGEGSAFINLPEKFLREPDLIFVDPEHAILEILESVEFTTEVIAGMRELRARGYRLALDDVLDTAGIEHALPYVQLVKLDLPLIPRDEWASHVEAIKARGLAVVAEKVEVEEDFRYLHELGCDYFQGYFFAKPKVVSGQRLPPNKLALLELLSRVNQPETEVDELCELVARDVALSVRVMNCANSPASGLSRRLDSVREAVVYVGRDLIRRWVTLSVLSGIDDKPVELLTMALSRARFMELLAMDEEREDCDAYFTVGLFSLLDVFLNADMGEVLKPLSLSPEVEAAIASHAGDKGEALKTAITVERGVGLADELAEFDEEYIVSTHLEANHWADSTVLGMAGGAQ